MKNANLFVDVDLTLIDANGKILPNASEACVPRTGRKYRELVKLLDRLIDEVGENEKHPLASLMEVIGVLIKKYKDNKVLVLF